MSEIRLGASELSAALSGPATAVAAAVLSSGDGPVATRRFDALVRAGSTPEEALEEVLGR